MAIRRLALAASLAAVLAVPLALPARADDLADGIKAIPGEVEDIQIGGTWSRGQDAGQYRLVVTRTGGDGTTARLFVQWVAYEDAGETKVLDTIEIKELADLKVDITSMNTESDDKGLSVFISTRDPNSPTDQTYELFVFSPTDYRFGPASN